MCLLLHGLSFFLLSIFFQLQIFFPKRNKGYTGQGYTVEQNWYKTSHTSKLIGFTKSCLKLKRPDFNNSKQNNNLLWFVPLQFVITRNLRSPREI